jgi:3-oxoacyl-[acyl-carrier-protein] synthase II
LRAKAFGPRTACYNAATVSFRVPVTGIGVVAPGAIGVAALHALIASDRTAIAPIDRFDTTGLSVHKAGLVRDFAARDFIAPMKLRRMNVLSRFGVAAAKMAISDCGTTLPETSGVAMGTAFGPVQTSVDYMQEYVAKGAALAPPHLFAESVANAPGSHIAIEHNLRGFNITVTQRESSALAAAMYACAQIVKGAAPAALTGGVEELSDDMVFSILDRIGALADTARPFDRRRSGLVPGEGSAVMALGTEGRPYGWLSGFGIARDTTATLSDYGTNPDAAVTAMKAALDDAELTTADIDAIFASANSTKRVDAVEAHAIARLFGERIPDVVATKGFFGEYAGGGAVHLASALIAMREQFLPMSIGFEEADESLPLAPTRATQARELRHIIINSISAGGGIVSAVISREGA